MPENAAEEPPRAGSHWLKLALDFGPILLFFVAYKLGNAYLPIELGGTYLATGVFMATSLISLAVTWRRERKVPPIPLITAAVVLVFGALTFWLRDETFLKLKLTIINALLAAVLIAGLVLRKPLVKHLFGAAFQLTDAGWSVMTRAWIVYFLVIAAANEVVRRVVTTDRWVDFKTFALPVATLVFVLVLTVLLGRHAIEPGSNADESAS